MVDLEETDVHSGLRNKKMSKMHNSVHTYKKEPKVYLD